MLIKLSLLQGFTGLSGGTSGLTNMCIFEILWSNAKDSKICVYLKSDHESVFMINARLSQEMCFNI